MKRVLCSLLVTVLLLAGCMAPSKLFSGNASLCLLPRINEGLTTQAEIPVYSKTSINHLFIKLFTLAGEVENPVMNGGVQITKDIPFADLDSRITFSSLRANTTYRVRGYAYKATGTSEADLISTAASYVDITVGSDDAPTTGNIPVLLINKDFNGQGTGSLAITAGGLYTEGSENLNVPYNISTIAGIFNYKENVPATETSLLFPRGTVVDAAGNLYIADTALNRVRRVDATTGIITLIAGNGKSEYSGNDGQATVAGFGSPYALALAGNILYVSDNGSHRIRKVDLTTGITSLVAGNGTAAFAGDNGQATSASLNSPRGIAILNNILYIADQGNHRVRQVDLGTGIITTVAGTGTAGYDVAQDGGQAISAKLNYPYGVAAADGVLYIADRYNHRVRQVVLGTGVITTVAGNGTGDYLGDGGQATSASLYHPCDVSIADGALYIADRSNDCIRKVVLGTGVISTVAGDGHSGFLGDGGQATSAKLWDPYDVTVGNGNIYIADYGNQRIRKVVLGTGVISTVAGSGTPFFSGDGGPASSAAVYTPTGLAVANNCLYIADQYNHRIRKIDLSTGVITTVAGNGTATFAGDGGQATSANLYEPYSVTVANGILYIADYSNHRVRQVNLSTGVITTIAGTGTTTYNAAQDGGLATSANLNKPSGLAVADNCLYIADRGNNRIRKVDLGTGIITTVAGSGATSFSGDGGQATSAGIYRPTGVVVSNGILYIAEQYSNRVRAVNLGTGIITTFAGNNNYVYNAAQDGGPATSASLYNPTSLAVANGYLFIADYSNHRIRKVNISTGIITTIGGNGVGAYAGDGGLAMNASLFLPSGVAADEAGYVYVADGFNHRIRRLD